jgi:crotonobetainyl-CoA:carnitine CoA-transferase CaiB-like acyl-CoA transferase
VDASAGAVGPWAGSLLAQLGAKVIKLESPQGDFIRNILPLQNGLSTTYLSMNYGKLGLELDMKSDAGKRAAHDLIAGADVFIENFRPGVAERIGLGWNELSALNPRLVYAAASGFGWSGPLVGLGATDPHIQAFSGSASVNGEPGGLRQRMRWYGHFDVNTALCIVQGVLAGLLSRARTGKGQRVEITMAEAAMALQRVRLAEHLAGQPTPPMGSATTYLCPDQAFAAQDGPVMVSVTSRRQWRAFCAAMGCEDLCDDPRFATNPLRLQNRDALIPLLEPMFRDRPAWRWVQVLTRAGVPAAQPRPLETLPTDLHIAENAMLRRFDTPDWGRITVAGLPWRFDGTPGDLWPGSPPGGDDAQVLDGGWPDLDPAARHARTPEAPLEDGA